MGKKKAAGNLWPEDLYEKDQAKILEAVRQCLLRILSEDAALHLMQGTDEFAQPILDALEEAQDNALITVQERGSLRAWLKLDDAGAPAVFVEAEVKWADGGHWGKAELADLVLEMTAGVQGDERKVADYLRALADKIDPTGHDG